MTQPTHTDLDRIFSQALDNDYSTSVFETMINEPGFWETATRWLAACNQSNARGSEYALNAKRCSKIISLLTAQPSNSQCDSEYEKFVIAAHDLLVTAAQHLFNLNHENLKEIALSNFKLPESVYLNQVRMEDAMNVLKDLARQVNDHSEWLYDDVVQEALGSLAASGELPLTLLDPRNVYFDEETGHVVVSTLNLQNKEALPELLALTIIPAMQTALIQHAIDRGYINQQQAEAVGSLTHTQQIALCLAGSPALKAFSYNWDQLRESAYQSLQGASAKQLDEDAIRTEKAFEQLQDEQQRDEPDKSFEP